MRRRYVALSLVALAFPLLAACADDDPATSTASTTATPQTSQSAQESAAAPTGECIDDPTLPSASKKVGSAPDISKPTGEPPCDLIVEDLKVGKGTPISDVATPYSWNYEGVSWSTGEIFDSSFERGEPIDFSLNQVIPGWTEGLQGMKPGGRRMLVIPPAQAYGASGRPGIAPNETLVFVVDLVGPAAGS